MKLSELLNDPGYRERATKVGIKPENGRKKPVMRLNKRCVDSFLVAIAAILIFAGTIGAQQSTPASRKFEEFPGETDVEDLKARLDNFAIELQSQPSAQAHIIVYRTRTAPASFSLRHAQRAADFLVEYRRIDRKRIVTVDGGMTGCFTYELWIVPPGAAPPERRFTYKYSLKESLDSESRPNVKPQKLRR